MGEKEGKERKGGKAKYKRGKEAEKKERGEEKKHCPKCNGWG